MNFYQVSGFLNRLCGGRGDQTLCARIAEQYGAQCAFCRIMSRLIEPNHCALQLAKWHSRQDPIETVYLRDGRP
ncbi:hypothetical protein EN780_31755 [Mesorhizobium sp. M4B.F.Ca.ET.089.01.1.1]|uniref:hypothetical protein n=1 Tax=Mesorhizobium sp. M4B.F.Ca.ET.089.01.1.1 TaxID=2496662 RepID=UPI000FE38634|nr:hypothetical protein [Mesorhizobium sp. M4B.F.Ca.ET.089.01.1.1]RWX60542.1 hypothetical protein EN780_31755 [Mesorhizobium sp. M4B.F.Ca.ET.089.01.1.1]